MRRIIDFLEDHLIWTIAVTIFIVALSILTGILGPIVLLGSLATLIVVIFIVISYRLLRNNNGFK